MSVVGIVCGMALRRYKHGGQHRRDGMGGKEHKRKCVRSSQAVNASNLPAWQPCLSLACATKLNHSWATHPFLI